MPDLVDHGAAPTRSGRTADCCTAEFIRDRNVTACRSAARADRIAVTLYHDPAPPLSSPRPSPRLRGEGALALPNENSRRNSYYARAAGVPLPACGARDR